MPPIYNKRKEISIIRIVCEFYPITGGSVSHISELAKKINPYLQDQIIIAPDLGSSKCKVFDDTFGIKIFRIKYIHFKKKLKIPVAPFITLSYSINICSKLKNMKRPDIIHCHGTSIVIFFSLIGKLLKIPVIGMTHGSAYKKGNKLIESLLYLSKPDHLIILDDGTNNERLKKLCENRYTVVYHGIDTDLFKPHQKNKQLLKKHRLNESDFIVLSTSSFIPFKNVEASIKAFKIFLDKYHMKNTYLLLAGNGILRQQLEDLVVSLNIKDNVLFLGNIPAENMVDYLSLANVVIATSLHSNMNRSIQEAMACETPIVAFDSGRTRDLVMNMKNGLLVEPENIVELADNLYLLYNNLALCQKIGQFARNTIVEYRNWDKRIQKELNIYETVL